MMVVIVQGYERPNPRDGRTQTKNDAASINFSRNETGRTDGVDINGMGHVVDQVKDRPEIQVVVFASSNTENTKTDIRETVRRFQSEVHGGVVVLAGHSLGGDNLIELVNDNPDMHIDYLITVDPVDLTFEWDDSKIPANVDHAWNFHQTEGSVTGEVIEKLDASQSNDVANTEMKGVGGHRGIDNVVGQNLSKAVQVIANALAP
jgi:hypothetical protein